MLDSDRRGPVLIAIARESLAADPAPAPRAWGDDWLREYGASFVTLKLEGELRGCIGSVDPRRALGDDVAHNAHCAAYRDPRFPPVSAGERDFLQVEVSVLSPRRRIAAASESDALAHLRPGIDGLVLRFKDCSATFLPQVWDNLPNPLDFLTELRRKARLPARFWHSELELSRYTVEKYR
jgi:AmmeMemoRadiSam system protein A